MKKLISVFLAAVLIFCSAAPAFAEDSAEKCDCGTAPVIYVCGMGATLYENPETEARVRVFAPETNTILKALPEIVVGLAGFLTGIYPLFGTFAIKAADKIMGKWACDSSGNSVYDIGIEPLEYPEEDTHQITNYRFIGPNRDDTEFGEFDFSYDWRLDPMYNAEILKNFVEYVKDLTGHDKVTLVCHSEGSTLVASYLFKYGSDDLEKVAFLAPAFQGLSIVGSLFCKEADLGDKSDDLNAFVKTMIGYNPTGNLVSALISLLQKAGVTGFVFDRLNKLFDSQFNRVYEDCLFNVFVTMPGMWSFVPVEKFDKAYKTAFEGKETEYAALMERVKYYHDNVSSKLVNLLNDASDNGTAIIIVSGYGLSSIPLSPTPVVQADSLIDTCYTSIGATCAPFGETFGDGYTQKVADGHNRISGDNVVDASTCAFPDYTWFIRYQPHSEMFEGTEYFFEWALTYDGQPTVSSNPDYPQFLDKSEDGTKLVPVTTPIPERSSSDIITIVVSLYQIIKEKIDK